MKRGQASLMEFDRIPALMEFLGLPTMRNEWMAVIDHDRDQTLPKEVGVKLLLRFYKISLKDRFDGKVR